MKLTDEQIERANSVNLPRFLSKSGFDLKKVGQREYIIRNHDSLNIYDNQNGERGKWYRFSRNEGGDNIGFVRKFMNKSFIEAVELLNDENYVREFIPSHSYKRKKADISVDENNDSKRVIAYLCKTRGLDYNMIARLVKERKIVQEKNTGNAVFKVFDENNKLIAAEKVGTSTNKKFKGIISGTDSGYGFEIVHGNGENALFFESAIDLLSYMQMNNPDNCRLISMMGVKPSIVTDTMKRYGILSENVYICSDNDKAGNEFYDRLKIEFPDIKRIKTEERYKDWNDMLRGNISEKEAEMITYGNKIWNYATDNMDKALIPMTEENFLKIQNELENSSINYYAYSKDGRAVIAVNENNIEWLKKIIGEDIEIRKSDVSYSPPQKNIIGNAEYRYIPQKEYVSSDSETILKMAEMLTKQNIKFSGRVYSNGKATITVSKPDLQKVNDVKDNIIAVHKKFADSRQSDIIGKTSIYEKKDLSNVQVEPKQNAYAIDKDNATFDAMRQKSETAETIMNVYHGTTADFDKFRPDYRGAVWTTTDFESAKRYAGNFENSKVYEVTARLENPKHIEFSTSENWDIDKTVFDANLLRKNNRQNSQK